MRIGDCQWHTMQDDQRERDDDDQLQNIYFRQMLIIRNGLDYNTDYTLVLEGEIK